MSLHYEIKELAKVAAIKEKNGHDSSKERELIKAYQKFTEEQYEQSINDRNKGLDPVAQTPPDALQCLTDPLKPQISIIPRPRRGRPPKITTEELNILDKSMAESKTVDRGSFAKYVKPRKERSDKGKKHAKKSKT